MIAVVDALGNLGVSEPPEPDPEPEAEIAAVFLDVCSGTKSPNDAIAAAAADGSEPDPEVEPGPEMDVAPRSPGRPQRSRAEPPPGQNRHETPGPRADRGVVVDAPNLCPNGPGDVEDQGYGGGRAGGATRRGRSRPPPPSPTSGASTNDSTDMAIGRPSHAWWQSDPHLGPVLRHEGSEGCL